MSTFLILPLVSVPEFFVTRPPECAQTNEFDQLFQRTIAANVTVQSAVTWWNRSKALSSEAPFDLFPESEFNVAQFYACLLDSIQTAKSLDHLVAVVFQRLSAPRITERQMEVIRTFIATPEFTNKRYCANLNREKLRAAIPQGYNLVAKHYSSCTADDSLRPLFQDYPSSKE